MSDGAGVVLIVVGALGVLVTAFVLRERLPGPVVFGLISGSSVVLGAGALVVQDHVTAVDWLVVVVSMALLGPVHARALLGPFGRHVRRAPEGSSAA